MENDCCIYFGTINYSDNTNYRITFSFLVWFFFSFIQIGINIFINTVTAVFFSLISCFTWLAWFWFLLFRYVTRIFFVLGLITHSNYSFQVMKCVFSYYNYIMHLAQHLILGRNALKLDFLRKQDFRD